MELMAVDKDTGKVLSPESAQKAADNPLIWTWVEWVPFVDRVKRSVEATRLNRKLQAELAADSAAQVGAVEQSRALAVSAPVVLAPEPSPVLTQSGRASFGPWASHSSTCRCNVCK